MLQPAKVLPVFLSIFITLVIVNIFDDFINLNLNESFLYLFSRPLNQVILTITLVILINSVVFKFLSFIKKYLTKIVNF